MAHNPYAAPASNVTAGDSYSSGDDVAASTLNLLRMTKGWARFLSIFAFVSGALILLVCVVELSDPAGFAHKFGVYGIYATEIGMVVLILYIVLALLFFTVPAIILWSYAGRIARLPTRPSTATLDSALNSQRLLLKYFGILLIVLFTLFGLLWLWIRSQAVG